MNVSGLAAHIEPMLAELAGRRATLTEEIRLIDYLMKIVKAKVGDGAKQYRTSAALITATVCSAYEISTADIAGKSRHRRYARPRQIAMWLCSEMTDLSLQQIGRLYKRDHTTVLHALRIVPQLGGADADMRDRLHAAIIQHFGQAEKSSLKGNIVTYRDDSDALTLPPLNNI
jgi:chromosomal replication initiator protein